MSFFDKIRNMFAGRDEADEEREFSFTSETEPNYDREVFLHSLSSFGPEDIKLSKPEKIRTSAERAGDLTRNILMIVCLAVFAVSSILLIDNLIQKQEGNALYDEAAAEFAAAGLNFGLFGDTASENKGGSVALQRQSNPGPASASLSDVNKAIAAGESYSPSNSGYNEELEKLRATLRSYKDRNEDVYGYISIPAVGIEYIMVQGEDNDFYLNNNWLKEYLVIGSIFVDYRCFEMIMHNFNTVIYGHNITTGSGSMFHGVELFKDEEIFKSALIYIYTMDGVYIYQPFSFYDTRAASGYIRTGFESKEDFVQFSAEMRERSRFDSGPVVDEDDRIITLSTCTNTSADGRYALHAVLVDYIT